MKKIKLYKDLYIDLARLIAGKLFIYANSGFGKSWLLRWFLEQTFGHIQQIIIDPEGEFSTLREKFDYVLIGKGKEFDIQADPRSAALLAHRLLQENVSAIIDLYELDPLERERFVANFTLALVNVPKNLHHPYLYVIDEAQDFAPEKGDALSSKALHAIAKKGRKRGCCPVFATQRVSDFSKAVIAACNNKFIGQASLDIDMKRCAAELGFTTREQMLSLRDLEPGEFHVFGSAISKTVQKVKIGAVKTTHPDSSKLGGKIGKKVAPASAKIKKALAALADLPQAAEEEAKTLLEFKTQLIAAKREISELKRQPIVRDKIIETEKIVEVPVLKPIQIKALEKVFNQLDAMFSKNFIMLKDFKEITEAILQALKVANQPRVQFKIKTEVKSPAFVSARIVAPPPSVAPAMSDGSAVTKGELAILKAIAGDPEGITTEHIAVLTDYKGTSRYEYLRKLQARGYAVKQGDMFIATQEGIEALGGSYEPNPTGQALIDQLLQTLPKAEKAIFEILLNAERVMTKDEISELTGYKGTSTYEYLRKLAARRLITINRGVINLTDKIR